jgi:hypothetical protein
MCLVQQQKKPQKHSLSHVPFLRSISPIKSSGKTTQQTYVSVKAASPNVSSIRLQRSANASVIIHAKANLGKGKPHNIGACAIC